MHASICTEFVHPEISTLFGGFVAASLAEYVLPFDICFVVRMNARVRVNGILQGLSSGGVEHGRLQ